MISGGVDYVRMRPVSGITASFDNDWALRVPDTRQSHCLVARGRVVSGSNLTRTNEMYNPYVASV